VVSEDEADRTESTRRDVGGHRDTLSVEMNFAHREK
jgi:hypothetical protein